MKKLYLKTDNIYALDCEDANVTDNKLQLSFVGEDGIVLKDNNSNDIILSSIGTSPKITFDGDLKKWKATIHFADTTVKQYARAFWVVTDSNDNPISVPGYYPEELSIENSPSDVTQAYTQMAVPASYFIDTFLADYPSISEDLIQTLKEINERNPDIIRNELLASQDILEEDIRTRFFKEQFDLDRDMYDDDFRQSHWINRPDYYPIISCDSFYLVYGNNQIALSNDIAESIKVDKNLGFFEWMPLVTSTTLFTMIISTLSGLAISSYASDYASRIPGLFRIKYTAGMDFPNLKPQKKERIRRLISRNCFCQMMPRIDSLMREANISQSLDGASLSTSSGIPKIIEQFLKDEARDIAMFEKELGTSISIAVS
jgi:hypothetical protein